MSAPDITPTVRSTADPILELEECAVLLRVTPNWLKRSSCPRIRNGGVVRFDRDVALAWFRSAPGALAGAGEGGVKERPILMSAPMVRALLDGRKTQTRRVVRGSPGRVYWNPVMLNGYAGWVDEHGRPCPCPYGQPGDRLWVRETLALFNHFGMPLEGTPQHNALRQRTWSHAEDDACGSTRRIPAIHMPRWASRLTLTLTDVRVERVQDISEADAEAEGVFCGVCRGSSWVNSGPDGGYQCPDEACGYGPAQYRRLWDSLNAARGYGWDVNPWVWVLTFEVTP